MSYWTRQDGSIEIDEEDGHVDLSVDGGATWDALSPGEAREMASALEHAAEVAEMAKAEK